MASYSKGSIESYQKAYNEAKAKGDKKGMADAHAGAEALRATQGWSGGADGSQYIPIGNKPSGGSYSGSSGSSSGYKPSYPTNGFSPNVNYQGKGSGDYTSQQLQDMFEQTRQNANAWANTTDQAERDRLHSENVNIYDKLGFDYDAATGKWTPGKAYLEITNPSAQRNDYTQQQKEMQEYYDQLRRDQEEQTRAAINQGVSRLQGQTPFIQQNYDDAARQAYIQMMQAQKALPEQLAANGISNSGASESAMVGIRNNYGQTLNDADIIRQNAINKLNSDIANLQATGNLQIAEGAQDISMAQLEAYRQALSQQNALASQQAGNIMNIAGMMGELGTRPTLAYQNAIRQWAENNRNFASDAERERWRRAMTVFEATGVASPEIAGVLGVPVGTKMRDWIYQQAQINAMNR